MTEDFSINEKSVRSVEDVLFRTVLLDSYLKTALDSLKECRRSAQYAGIRTMSRDLTPAAAKALDVYDLA